MLSLEEWERMVKTYETTRDADLTADIFGINKSNVYKWVRIYRKTVPLNSVQINADEKEC